MTPIRFAIVGCGGISNLHAECLQKLQAEGLAQLVAGAEIDPARAKAWSEKWSVPVLPNLTELLKRTDIDAVTITTPSGLHSDQAIQIAESGRHILSEKPLDLHLAKADAAIAAAAKHKVTLGGIFQQRFAPGPQKVKRAIDQGFFGQIIFAHCETPWYRTQKYYDSGDWRGTWALDGGVLCNQSPHMIDRLLWLAGDLEEVTSADLKCGFQRNIEAETVAVATVRLASGALGTITGTTLAYDGLPQRVLICGTDGSAAFDGDTLTYFKTRNPFESETTTSSTTTATEVRKDGASNPLDVNMDGHLGNIRDFARALHEKRQPYVTGAEYRKVVRALNMIYTKAKVGPWA